MEEITKEMEIEALEEEIGELPVGYISRKNIHGKIRYYRQWTENGKIKSQYIKEEDLEEIEEKIARRRELQQRLKELNQKVKGSKRSGGAERRRGMTFAENEFETNVIIGEELLTMARNIQSNRKRDCYKQLAGYLHGEGGERVCIVSGLRRTGKTTMIRQAILEMEPGEVKKAAYIKTTAADNMEIMNRDLKRLNLLKYKYVFIDEITLMGDFIDSAALLSDIYGAQGMRIVLTGTDSLAFGLAVRQELFDRAIVVRTTFIPFREYSRLLGVDSIDEYIRYGGTLRAGKTGIADMDDLLAAPGGGADVLSETGVGENTRSGIPNTQTEGSESKPTGSDGKVQPGRSETAPTAMIGHPTEPMETFALFRDRESTKDYIESAVCRNIQRSLAGSKDKSQFGSLRTLMDSGELMKTVNQVLEDMNLNFLLLIATENKMFHELQIAVWNLRNDRMRRQQAKGITKAHLSEIKEALVAVDLIVECPAETARPGTEPIEKVIFTQPGMRYSQVQMLVEDLMNGERFGTISQADKKELSEKILAEVRGRMLEEMVLMETEKALSDRYQVFKMQYATGEFDMVVYDTRDNNCTLCEVRGTNLAIRNRFRRVPDAEKYRQIEKRFGTITEKIMLCRDPNLMAGDGNKYCRIEDYLRSLSF